MLPAPNFILVILPYTINYSISAARQADDNRKTTTATIYLEELAACSKLFVLKDKSKLPNNQFFKKPIKQRNSPQVTTQETKVTRNTLSQKPRIKKNKNKQTSKKKKQRLTEKKGYKGTESSL